MKTVPLKKQPDDKRTESVVQAEIRKVIGALPDVRLWRNNTLALPSVNTKQVIGLLSAGKTSQAVTVLKQARLIKCGLAVGSSDLIGIVGPYGRFLAIECKAEKGRTREEQTAWIEIIRNFGGVAGYARSVEDAMTLVEEARVTPPKLP